MKKYNVYASETVYYQFEVMAEDEEQAHRAVEDHILVDDDISDASNFEFEVTEIVSETATV